jgi:hypothetical protein
MRCRKALRLPQPQIVATQAQRGIRTLQRSQSSHLGRGKSKSNSIIHGVARKSPRIGR